MVRPNILWICTDQQRFDTLGCYGNTFVRTPNLDRLAEAGTLFENAFSQSPVCTPSRASFLTGRYPRTCRTRQNGADIPAQEVLVTRILADAGYVCGLSSKLHLSTCNPSACETMERRIDDGYAEFLETRPLASVEPLLAHAARVVAQLCEWDRLGRESIRQGHLLDVDGVRGPKAKGVEAPGAVFADPTHAQEVDAQGVHTTLVH